MPVESSKVHRGCFELGLMIDTVLDHWKCKYECVGECVCVNHYQISDEIKLACTCMLKMN